MKVKALAILAVITALTSCTSTKTNLPYFTNIEDDTVKTLVAKDYNVRLAPDDELLITVNSESALATAAYNLPLNNPALEASLAGVTSQPQQQTYVVNTKGEIDFPLLGKINVAGKTTEEVKEILTNRIKETVEAPLVNVVLVNFKVKVLGEVATPGSIAVSKNRYTILDAIADAGDLTQYGERDNVLLIRQENGEVKYYRFSLNNDDIFRMPQFYLQQNDAIYVSPNKIRQENSKYNQNSAFKLSITSTVVSAASVIASLVIALTIK